jgi:hypothetical protein
MSVQASQLNTNYRSRGLTNNLAETPMLHAPHVRLKNGRSCIPQHYLEYQQSLVSLQETLAHIQLDQHSLLFADQDANGLYLQVGMIGRENYERGNLIRARKLVYGRKWRIESYTPTSEVIQTAFLAVKKAREHEIRELFTLREPVSGRASAVFSCHQDLPLMANNRDLCDPAKPVATLTVADIQACLSSLRVGQRRITLLEHQQQKGMLLLELQLGSAPLARMIEGDFPELDHHRFFILLKYASAGDLLHEIMDSLIQGSDRHIAETFLYQGYARFSRKLDPFAIAALSLASRPYAREQANARFDPIFKQSNYQVDALRVPALGKGRLARCNAKKLAQFPKLDGHMPADYLRNWSNKKA